MTIPFFDYRAGYAALRPEIEAAIARVLASGQLILGPEVTAFETEFARYVEARHAVGVASGTDALALALRACGIGAGDEVVTVANAGAPTVAAIRLTGALPRFVDVCADTLLLDPTLLAAATNERTRAIVPVHLYGQPVELAAVLAFARERRLRVIEDCAQAHGAAYRGRRVGTFGDVGCFSFYPTKNLGAYGDGGLCTTNDATLAERLRMLRMYGFKEGDRHAHLEGVNSRLDELQAAILRIKLRHLDRDLAARRRVAHRYRETLRTTAIRVVAAAPEREHAWHLFVIQSDARDAMQSALTRAGIASSIHYPVAAHLMEAYRGFGAEAGDLPVTEQACATVCSLPLFPELPESSVAAVGQALRAWESDRG